EAKKRWLSLVLLAPIERVQELVNREELVYLTFINTDSELIISGDRDRCLSIAEQLKCPAITIPFQNIIHHDFCGREREGLLDMHNFPLENFPEIDFYSSITKSKIPLESQLIAENSTNVCAQQVDFPSITKTVAGSGATIFIEVGANNTCTNWINTILQDRPHLAVAIDQKGKKESETIAATLAQLISHGVQADLSFIYPERQEEKEPARFLKTIQVGGARLFDLISNRETKQLFKEVQRKEPAIADVDLVTGSMVRTSAGREVITAASSVTMASLSKQHPHIDKQEVLREAVSSQQPLVFNASKMQSSVIAQIPDESGKKIISKKMELNTATAVAKPVAELAENGLKLQDFSTGEQFAGKEIVFSQEDLVEFANGQIAKVFGPEYAVIDNYRRRVMLPMDPYLLVSRVTKMDAVLGEYKPSTMQTEYDIPYNAWFTTDGQIPWAVSVESGQCDLLLISYLGIDLQNKGNLVYRLLDCTLTFVDDLPYEGQTLRYDISINSFVRNGDNLLFFFSYRCYVQDRLVLKMDGGCAGFFSDEELDAGNGVVYKDSEIAARQNAERKFFTPFLRTNKTSFSKGDLKHLIDGNIEKCFEDESYFANGLNPSLRLPPEKILMLDRIVSVDTSGGAYGLGLIVAEKDLQADDWYFPCHFRDDEVLAGSLQSEGGGNLLRFYMLMLGLQRRTKDARFQPIFDLPQKVRCRKQVTPKDTKLVYKLEVKEIGLIPDPYVIGDLEIISNGVVTVHFENLGLQLREKSNPRYLEEKAGISVSPRSEGSVMNEHDLTTFALGDLTDCFGPEYAVYKGRTLSRQPNGDLQLISRVLKVDGTRGDLSKNSTIYTEYDVPEGAWYYQQNSASVMPYSILMEIGLQPCGLLGAYLGSTLIFRDQDLYLRNLDGDGELVNLVSGTDLRRKIISNKSVLVSSIAHGDTILQRYTFELSVDGQVFYSGSASFGFFTKQALAGQAGLDKGQHVPAWYKTEKLQPRDYMQIKLDSLYGKMKLFKAPENKPHYRLAADQLNMVHNLIIAKDKGNYGKGYIYAQKFVKTYDWYFTCHFYQDPVMPGSLGVESILQAMQVYALHQDLGKDFISPKFEQVFDHKTVWKYRGQILLDVKEMSLEVHIKSVEQRSNQLVIIGDAYLWNGEMRIYQVTDLALGIEEA
ncbi:MAG: PfaB family protein, partial [Bacteroidota bacterium]